MHFRIALVGALALCACSASENDARQYLQGDGVTVTSLKRTSKTQFEYTGKKGDQICTGTVTLAKGFGSTTRSHFESCKRDTSACKPGAAAACDQIADELYEREAKVFPVAAAELYRVACADKDGHACERAGEFEAIEKHWDKVRDYSSKGCDLGNGDACTRLGFTELEGQGTAKNPARALELLKQGCDKASMRGCRGAAGLMLDADPPDAKGALPLAKKACVADYQDGCFVYGMAMFKLKKDYAEALKNFDAACNDDKHPKRGMACNMAGAITFDGLGMKKDPARGVAYFEKSCDADFAQGCSNAGRFLKKGAGVPRDADKAAALLAKACKLGAKDACGT